MSRPCAEIDATTVRWLWHPFLARGKLSVFDGDPGTGKSFLTVDLAARLSRGVLPDGQPLSYPHTTLILNAEDDASDTIRPRASAAGADLSRVVVVGSPSVSDPMPQFPDCVPGIMRLVVKHAADLLVIDPMMAYFPPQASANNDQRIRQSLMPLAAVAHDTGCAVLLVRHLSKAAGRNAVYRGSGSVGILGTARTGLLLARHPDDPDLRMLVMTKTNLGPVAQSVGFRMAGVGDAARIEWCGPVDLSADELCGAQMSGVALRPRERAAAFLREALATGPRAVAELEKLAAERGLSWITVKRAKEELRVKSEQRREGGQPAWYWLLEEPKGSADAPKPLSMPTLDAIARHIWSSQRIVDSGNAV